MRFDYPVWGRVNQKTDYWEVEGQVTGHAETLILLNCAVRQVAELS